MTQGSQCPIVQYNDSYNPFTVAENNFFDKTRTCFEKIWFLQIDLLRMLHFSGSSCTISGKVQALYI